ncbi:hypothetical protein N665_0609s0023 [Sinapis alba]|nr:hypothetical protein N665_0609s0023 [Sinapis alba]
MSGQSGRVGSKRPREVFLTSSSLSFSSLSSSCTSSSDAIEISTKASGTSHEDQNRGKLVKAYSPDSETLCVTDVSMEPGPSSRPVQLMNECFGTHYDPERIPASVFAKSTCGDLNWSEVSNDSLFTLRMSTCQAFRQSNIKLEESEFLAYSPSLLVNPKDAEEKRSQVKEQAKSVVTSVKTHTHRESSATSTSPVVSFGFDQLYQAPKTKSQAFPLPQNKKRKKTRKSKKTNKKKQDMRCIWSWLCSGVSKCKCNLHCCYKWRKCCSSRGPKAI